MLRLGIWTLMCGVALAAGPQSPNNNPACSPGDLSPSDIGKIQQSLNAKGFQVPVDNKWDPADTRAIRDFQASKGIPGAGQLNDSTFSALGVSVSCGTSSRNISSEKKPKPRALAPHGKRGT